MHDADPGAGRLGGVRKSYPLPIDQDLARIRHILAAEDLHQRRLAGAILAAQSMHFPGKAIEGNVNERKRSAKRLGDTAHLQTRRRAAHAGTPSKRNARMATSPVFIVWRPSNKFLLRNESLLAVPHNGRF